MDIATGQKRRCRLMIYEYKCADCHKVFRTDQENAKACPSCLKARQPHHQYGKKRKKPKILSFAEILHIAEVYNKIHHRYIHYGEIVKLIEANPKRCVCCGATVYKGKHVCNKCESGHSNIFNIRGVTL